MNIHAEHPKKNKSQSVANTFSEKRTPMATFQLSDNRPEAAVQRKLQEIVKNSSQATQFMTLQKIANNKTAQLVAATAKGSTHLVKINNKSIMKGTKGEYVVNGDALDVDPDTRVISRRGSNQELVGDYDKRGEHMYRWYKANAYKENNIAGQDKYIREGTFLFNSKGDEPLKAHNLEDKQDRRSRKSHIAVRFEVWNNTNRKIDDSGHLVMSDMSKESRGRAPYYAYEMGEGLSPQGAPTEERIILGHEDTDPKLARNEKAFTSVSVLDARDQSKQKRVPGDFKTLDQPNEHHHEINERLKARKRYVSTKTGVGYMTPQDGRVETQRFNEKKWVEMLLTKDEYNFLMGMWEMRQQNGFYCFIREARTEIGYKFATRCLSSLEDIAIIRRQNSLVSGHAMDILNDFKTLNSITDKHTGRNDIR